ncbi:MAG: hypothetical protein WC867_05335 [Candidatus Pacearchaeota archaeon]|jgi:hypothetical protein
MGEIDDIIASISTYKNYKEKKPSAAYKLMYDSSTEGLEPLYFWILDMAKDNLKNVDKLVDNFASSPGGGHFSELQSKASQMQQEASRILGTVNNILKGVLNLIYDIKEFKIRLSHYDSAKSSESAVKEAGMLALKQIWMDKVDLQRGQGSINALSSGNLQFVTLRDAFMTVNKAEDVDKLDLNERVKRLLKPRVQEFLEWKIRSEQELRKRYEIEKIYLKSQVDALKLNARWAKPYLRAAQQLMPNERLSRNEAMVTAFNTIMLELSLLGRNELNIRDLVEEKRLPRDFVKIKKLRKYYSVVVIDFLFRGIPYKSGQHYTFGGRAEVNFKAYTLNEDEYFLLNKKLEQSDLETALKLVQGMTDDSLKQLQLDIDEILENKEDKNAKTENLNPFSALFSNLKFFKVDEKKLKKDKEDKLLKLGPKKENYAEKYIRNLAEADAKDTCFRIYDLYKKGHGMAAFPYVDDTTYSAPTSKVGKFFGFK